MYSNTQLARLYSVGTIRLRMPLASMMMISPGSTSRTNSAPTVDNAHDSDASIQPPLYFPRQSGRMPHGSRKPNSCVSLHNTMENAPMQRFMVRTMRSSMSPSGSNAIKRAMMSVSELLVGTVVSLSRSRNALVFT